MRYKRNPYPICDRPRRRGIGLLLKSKQVTASICESYIVPIRIDDVTSIGGGCQVRVSIRNEQRKIRQIIVRYLCVIDRNWTTIIVTIDAGLCPCHYRPDNESDENYGDNVKRLFAELDKYPLRRCYRARDHGCLRATRFPLKKIYSLVIDPPAPDSSRTPPLVSYQ